MNIDLHLHSIESDGSHSPDIVVNIAKDKGVKILSLTDHDTTSGILEAKKAAQKLSLTLIDGIEIQADINKYKYEHILAYNVQDYVKMNHFLEKVRQERLDIIYGYIKQFHSIGFPIDLENIDSTTPGKHLTIWNIAKYLASIMPESTGRDVYNLYLSPDSKYHIPLIYHYYDEVIKLIKDCGGIAVLAHPFRYNSNGLINPNELSSHIKMLKEVGLDGIESYYGIHNTNQISICNSFAIQYDLIETGGSDWHGWEDKADIGVKMPEKDIYNFLKSTKII